MVKEIVLKKFIQSRSSCHEALIQIHLNSLVVEIFFRPPQTSCTHRAELSRTDSNVIDIHNIEVQYMRLKKYISPLYVFKLV